MGVELCTWLMHGPQVQAEVANAGRSHLLETLFTAWQEHHTAVKKMKNILIYPVRAGP